ncbi:MAG: TonB-dependent receptor plug domain-containing protein, partial [Rhodanobacteraceae bacterium]
VTPGGGSEVDFAGSSQNAQELAAMQVSASALPPIDVKSVASSYTVDAAELDRLPVGRSAESIALLSPGVVAGSGYFGNVVTVAGAGATENAYYVNGYNTTALYDYSGSAYQLPYNTIAQQETIIGGYGAKYGRSDGGVINQIGKRGTNEWHFGGQALWEPRSLRSDADNWYYPDVPLGTGEVYVEPGKSPGDLLRYRKANTQWRTRYSAYVGGPLVEDKLFFFLSAEQSKYKRTANGSVGSGQINYDAGHDTNWYGKIDWNINENNILEYTKLKESNTYGYGGAYDFDNETLTQGAFVGSNSYIRDKTDTNIFHYTGYLSDNATLSVLYGYTEETNPIIIPNASENPFISRRSSQNPAYLACPTCYANGDQTNTRISSPDRASRSKSLRADFDYQLGDHLLQVGIDNLTYSAKGQGRAYAGPGYLWQYLTASDPTKPINEQLNVGAPGDTYYVRKITFNTITSLGARQQAWYVQDNWQITPNLMLKLGLRNDEFHNSNGDGQDFVVEKNQWEPRLGFSWDVNGDSSLKIYGNAGRYYLALPQSVGERAATQSTNTSQYFTYGGIDSNGVPTGLVEVPGVGGGGPPGPVSANNEFGTSPDPATVAATNLKPQYQDEFIVGFDKTWGPNWNYGAKLTYRTIGTVIDDECAAYLVADKIASMGLNPDNYKWDDPYCRLFNPNKTADLKVLSNTGGDPIIVSMTQKDFGFPKVQRDYYGLDLYLDHPFDGTWSGRIDYTFSRSWGNAEGQVRSDIGQTDTSKTEDWDYWQLMSGARGYLANHRRHSLKARGAWQVTPEVTVGGTLLVQSGAPQSCLGLFGPDETNPGGGYGSDYHWCRGKIYTPGSTTTPWLKQLNLNAVYRPMFADQKLAFKLQVYNVTNEQSIEQTQPHLFNRPGSAVNNQYHAPLFAQTPRYVQFAVSYDF